MKKIINILLGSTLALVFAFSLSSSASAQVCITTTGQQGNVQNGICIGGNSNIPLCSQVPAGTTCRPDTGGGVYNPGVAGAVGQSDLSFFQNLIGGTGSIVSMLPPILIGIAVVVFFAYLIVYLIGGKDPESKKKHLKGMMYSLLAIFVMVCLWGIIYFVASTLDINLGGTVPAPKLPY